MMSYSSTAAARASVLTRERSVLLLASRVPDGERHLTTFKRLHCVRDKGAPNGRH